MAQTAGVVDSAEFERMVRDGLANLFDQAALATHPLASLVGRQLGQGECRPDELRQAMVSAIEQLRPAGEKEPEPCSPEWRPYLVLHGRYIDGSNLQQLQSCLSLSERQLRREHSRAIQAVATLLWHSLFPGDPMARAELTDETTVADSFPIRATPLDITDLVNGVMETLQRRAESEGARLEIAALEHTPRVLADRVILRQVLFSLLSYVLDLRDDGPVIITTQSREGRVILSIQFSLEDPRLLEAEEEGGALDRACYWCNEIDACLSRGMYQPGVGQLALSLPGADESLMLVVDDQETALRLFERYLGHTDLRLVGVRSGSEVLPLARRLQPKAITLDVMMPEMDGWEVLQSLQADPATSHIPVIVCSVWEEPELASSLGAADFLGKPIKQKDLLAALARLRLLDT